jgi:hypothetical protein
LVRELYRIPRFWQSTNGIGGLCRSWSRRLIVFGWTSIDIPIDSVNGAGDVIIFMSDASDSLSAIFRCAFW